MKKLTCLSGLIILLSASSCGNRHSSGELITVDVTKSYPEKTLVLQDFADVEYLPLETKDYYLEDKTPYYMDDEILIFHISASKTIVIFDRVTGAAIGGIARKGRGPGEYSRVDAVSFDKSKGELFVCDRDNSKIIVYDINGRFLRELPTDGHSYNSMFDYNSDNLLCYDFEEETVQPFVLVSKADDSIAGEITLPFTERRIFKIDIGSGASLRLHPFPILRDGNGFVLSEFTSDTIYRHDPSTNSITPFAVRHPSLDVAEIPCDLAIGAVTDDYIFVSYYRQKIEGEFSFSNINVPSEKLVFDVKASNIYTQKIVNADYGGDTFYTVSGTSADYPAGQKVYRIPALELVDAYESGLLSGELEKIASTLKEDDNPVLMIVKFK